MNSKNTDKMEEEIIKTIRENEAGIIYDDGSYGRVLKELYFKQVAQEIVKLFAVSSVSSSLSDSDEVYRMAHELDEKEFDQWMFEQQ